MPEPARDRYSPRWVMGCRVWQGPHSAAHDERSQSDSHPPQDSGGTGNPRRPRTRPLPWLVVDQELIDDFGRLTGDRQWIHVDVDRASRGAFGGTIAHGLLTLSLTAHFNGQLISFDGLSQALNHGCQMVRFPASLPAGRRLRMTATVSSVEKAFGGFQIAIDQILESEGADRPVCVAVALVRVIADD